jgi:hypothetical protein
MSNGDDETVRKALGGICMISEKSTSHGAAKLDSVTIGSDDAYYMLAAFCFDLSRKLNYVFMATRDFAQHADPALARQVLEDGAAINQSRLSWEQRARKAEEILLRSVREFGEEHERLLRQAAGGSEQAQ